MDGINCQLVCDRELFPRIRISNIGNYSANTVIAQHYPERSVRLHMSLLRHSKHSDLSQVWDYIHLWNVFFTLTPDCKVFLDCIGTVWSPRFETIFFSILLLLYFLLLFLHLPLIFLTLLISFCFQGLLKDTLFCKVWTVWSPMII